MPLEERRMLQGVQPEKNWHTSHCAALSTPTDHRTRPSLTSRALHHTQMRTHRCPTSMPSVSNGTCPNVHAVNGLGSHLGMDAEHPPRHVPHSDRVHQDTTPHKVIPESAHIHTEHIRWSSTKKQRRARPSRQDAVKADC